MRQQTLTQMYPASPAAMMPSAVVTPSPTVSHQQQRGHQGDILPPGWAVIADANSGRPVWVHAESDRVVFRRVDMYMNMKESVPSMSHVKPSIEKPDCVTSLHTFFGKSDLGSTKASPVELLSSSDDDSDSSDSDSDDDSKKFLDCDLVCSPAAIDAAVTIVEMNQDSDNNNNDDDDNKNDRE